MNWQNYKDWLGSHLKSELPVKSPCPTLHQIATDSRDVKKGDWFMPLKGETYDGHTFLQTAIDNGAAGYFIKEGMEFKSNKVPHIVVQDTMKAYHLLANGWRRSLPKTFQLVALTGSVGKTTAKTMTSMMLSHFANTFSTPGNQNTEFSIPKAIFDINSTHHYAVLEFGARHPGDIAFLTETAAPDVCVCLNVASAHLEIFKDRATIMNTKLEIISKSPQSSSGVVHFDNTELFQKAKLFKRKIFGFGYNKEADVCILSEKQTKDGMEISFKIKDDYYILTLPVYHQSYAINAAAALCIGLALHLPASDCIQGLSTFSGLKGRYNVLKMKSGQILIDDAYNASPESMKSGLRSVHETYKDKKKLLILGDMRELGNFSEEAHKDLAQYCTRLNPVYLITVGKYSKHIAEESFKQGMDAKISVHFESVDELLEKIHSFTKGVDLIYVKGSFAIQLSKIVDELSK